jgi:DNA-directed RNA polymerase sigma subunit (sigma70/sigma32)
MKKDLTKIKLDVIIYLKMKNLNNADIAKVLNISRERVRQIFNKRLDKKNRVR